MRAADFASGRGFGRREFIMSSLALPLSVTRASGASPPAGSPRIVALDWGWAETLVAMERPPIAIVERTGYQDIVVEPPLPDTVLDLGIHTEPNLERLYRLKPDLIVSTPALESIRHVVEKVAPVLSLGIFPAPDGALPMARQKTMLLAQAIGAGTRGERLLGQEQETLEATRKQIGDRRARVFLVRIVDARHGVVYGRNSLLQGVLDALDLTNAWKYPTSAYGTANVGLDELLSTDDTWLISIGLGGGGTLEMPSGPFWDALPFVRNRRLLRLPSVWAFGAVPSAMRFARLLGTAMSADRAE